MSGLQRPAGYMTAGAGRPSSRAQRAVEEAERARDEIASQALAHGLGVRGAALALGIDKGTVSRRYNGAHRERRASPEPNG